MKKLLVLSQALLVTVVCLSGFAFSRTASLHFASASFDFGQVKKGEPVSHTFEFTNPAGQEILITNPAGQEILITKATASCGCTVTDYTREAVAPGKAGFVKATYNAAKTGMFTKTVTIYHNASDTPVILTIKGEVVE